LCLRSCLDVGEWRNGKRARTRNGCLPASLLPSGL
jgi:hypothetical protein